MQRDNFVGANGPDQDMTGGRYAQSDSECYTTDMVQIPTGVIMK